MPRTWTLDEIYGSPKAPVTEAKPRVWTAEEAFAQNTSDEESSWGRRLGRGAQFVAEGIKSIPSAIEAETLSHPLSRAAVGGVQSSFAGAEHLAANIADLVGADRAASHLRQRSKEVAALAAENPATTVPEKIAHVGGALPLSLAEAVTAIGLAAPAGAAAAPIVGLGALGALEASDKGLKEAIREGGKSAAFGALFPFSQTWGRGARAGLLGGTAAAMEEGDAVDRAISGGTMAILGGSGAKQPLEARAVPRPIVPRIEPKPVEAVVEPKPVEAIKQDIPEPAMGKPVTSQKVLDRIILQTEGQPDIRALNLKIKGESDYYVKEMVPVKNLNVSDSSMRGVDPTRVGSEKGAIVVDNTGNIIDGRHRVARAIARGEESIEAYRPIRPPEPLPKVEKSVRVGDETLQVVEKGQAPMGPGWNYTKLRDVEVHPPAEKIPRELRSRGNILHDLAKDLKLPIQQGRLRVMGERMGPSVGGFYMPKRGTLRIRKWGDIQVASHEVFHALADRYPQVRSWYEYPPGSQPSRAQAELHGISYDIRSVTEGYAELGRLWMTQKNEALAKAPNAVREFESIIETLPAKERKALYKSQEEMHDYFASGGRAALSEATSEQGAPLSDVLHNRGDEIRQGVADDFHGLRMAERVVEGGQVPDGIWESARRLRGIPRITEGIIDIGVPKWQSDGSVKFEGKPLQDILAPVSRTMRAMDDSFAYMTARQAQETTALGIENLITPNMIKAGLKLETPARKKAFDDLVEFQSRVADFAEQGGLFNAEQRAMWRRDQYAYSFARQMGETKKRKAASGEALTSTSGVYKMRGSSRNLKPALDALLEGPARLIQLTLENQERLKIADFAKRPGAGQLIQRIPAETKEVRVSTKQVANALENEMRRLGLPVKKGTLQIPGYADAISLYVGGQKPYGENVMTALRNGKPEHYEIFDSLMLRSIQAMRRPSVVGVEKFFTQARRFIQSTVTMLPDFMYRNGVRDPLMASIMTRTGFQHLTAAASGLKSAIVKDPYYKDYMANGGGGATIRESPANMRRKIIRHARKTGFDPRYLIVTPADVFRALETIGRTIELGPRIGEYKRGLRKGETQTHATFLGRDVSTDFAATGDRLRFAMNTIPFFNAMTQGADRLYRGVARDQGHRLSTAGKIGMVGIMSAGLYYQNKDQEWYKKLPDWDRNSYWHFGFGPLDENGDPLIHFKLPKIWEVGSIGSIAERALESALGSADAPLWKHALEILAMNFSIDFPAGMGPAIEQYANKVRFTGAPIETPSMQQLDPWQRSSSRTPKILTRLGRLERNLPREAQVSPARAEALLRGLFNSFASYGFMLTDAVDPMAPSLHWSDLPILKSMIERPDKYNRYPADFYKFMRETDQAYSSMKNSVRDRDFEAVREYQGKPETMLFKSMDRIHRAVTARNRYIRSIDKDPTLSKDKKRELRDEAIKDRDALMRMGVEMYHRKLGGD